MAVTVHLGLDVVFLFFKSTVFISTVLTIPTWVSCHLCETGLQHERGEVRQMSSALLNNYSLLLGDALPSASQGQELTDETTQILFGALDGMQDETSEVGSNPSR